MDYNVVNLQASDRLTFRACTNNRKQLHSMLAKGTKAMNSKPLSAPPTTMSRRSFCKALVAGASVATTSLNSSPAIANPEIQPYEAFASSFDDVPEAYGPTRVSFDRPLPKGLTGTLYRNGPARMHRGDTSYHHWFDGDGMVHSFTLSNNAVTHLAKMVRTDRLIAEEKAGRFLWGGFGTSFDHSLPVNRPDDVNVANISVLPIGDEVLALWEAGSAWRVDAATLKTLGRKVFSAETDGLPFSAHPRIDASGRIWNFGYLSGSGKMVLYDISANGQLNRTSVIDAPNADMVHDFAITERYLVFVLQPLLYSNNAAANIPFVDRLHWDKNQPVHVLVIEKETLQAAHRFELPAFFAFHMGNAWQDENTLRIEVATAPSFEPLMRQIVQATRKQLPDNASSRRALQPRTMEITLDLRNSRASLNDLPTSGIDFPRYDMRFTGLPTQQLFMMGRSRVMPDPVFGFNTVTCMNRNTDSEATFDYGSQTIAEEHLFVAAPGDKQGKGWLIGTSYDWKKCTTSLSVFNAEHVEDGPVATAQLPYGLPLGLHGQFV